MHRVAVAVGWTTAIALTVGLATGVVPLEAFRRLGLPGLAIISFLTAMMVEFAVPGIVTIVGYALTYPLLPVGGIAGVATGVGAFVKFELARASARHLPLRIARRLDWLASTRVGRGLATYPSLVILVLAVIPNPLFDPVLVLAGIRGVSARRCVLALVAGKTLRCVLIAYGAQAAVGRIRWF